MSDFEDFFDQLRVDLAETESEKSRAEGFIEGKKFARKEVLVIFLFLTGLAVFIYVL